MAPEQRSVLAQLARLRREIATDHAALSSRLTEAREIFTRWEQEPPDEPWITVAAVVLHAWYTGLETLLERIARLLDENVPRGDASHRELISQMMAEIPDVRPPVLPADLTTDLLSLLSFRHFFRHAYAVKLDPAKVRLELDRLLRVGPRVHTALDELDDVLEAAQGSLKKQP